MWIRNVWNIGNEYMCRLLDENVRRGNGWCKFQGSIIVIGVIKFLKGRLE